MLKQALLVLEQLSPRLCRLTAQIWDLTSLNFFVLIQLAHAAIDENEQLRTKSRNAERFHDELLAQQTTHQQRHELELNKLRLECQGLRAELQKTRQKQNRLAVENSQLQQAISGLVDSHDPLVESARSGSSRSSAIAHVEFEADVAVVGDAEEREFYGVSSDDLSKIETIHPIESLAQDLELLFDGLVGQERLQMQTLNDLDRFINSSTVSLLWQYGSSEEEHRLMHKMMNARSIASQTDAVESERRRDGNAVSEVLSSDATSNDVNNNTDSTDESNSAGGTYASGETGNATLVTKRQTIPPSLRAQLSTRPKIQRVLEKDQLNRLVLRLYLEKLSADAVAVRTSKPRTELHTFMKQFFLDRYGIAPLADFHMMEVVKSALLYHEHHEVEHRRVKALGLPTLSLLGVYPLHDSSSHFAPADIRVALFSRVCELVPLSLTDVPIDGNLFACLTNAVVDLIGDVVELDASVNSLEHVAGLAAADQWDCSSDLAVALVNHHLVFAERSVLDDACARIAQLTVPSKASANAPARIHTDVFLAVFATAWLDADQRLTRKLRDGFKRQLVTLSPTGALSATKRSKAASKHDHSDRSSSEPVVKTMSAPLERSASTESAVESLVLVCATLPDESLSALDLDALRTALEDLVLANHELGASATRAGRRKTATSSKKHSTPLAAAPAGVCIGGVSEKAFVSTAVQVLRARRNTFGIRTHSRLPSTAPMRMSQLGASRQLVALMATHDHGGDLPLEMLKPGLEAPRTRAVSTSKQSTRS